MSTVFHPTVGCRSPWGRVESVRPIAGSGGELLVVCTCGHGGYWLGPHFAGRFSRTFAGFEPWAGMPWLEEDLDAALAPLAFPSLFGSDAQLGAICVVRANPRYHAVANLWLDTNPEGQRLAAKLLAPLGS